MSLDKIDQSTILEAKVNYCKYMRTVGGVGVGSENLLHVGTSHEILDTKEELGGERTEEYSEL